MKSQKLITIFISLMFLGSMVGFAVQISTPGSQTKKSELSVFVCDQQINIPLQAGPTAIHTGRKRNILYSTKDAPLGLFFDSISADFNGTMLYGNKNGDECPDGFPGEVKMFVNGKRNYEFEKYIPKNGDKIRIEFG